MKLEELKRLEREATARMLYPVKADTGRSADWRAWNDQTDDREWTVSPHPEREGWTTDCAHSGYCIPEPDAKLLATARNMLPKLIAVAEAGRRLRDAECYCDYGGECSYCRDAQDAICKAVDALEAE